MTLRLWKIGLLAGPMLMLAGVTIIIAFGSAMGWQLADTVYFSPEVSIKSLSERQLIKKSILGDTFFTKPRSSLVRYKVTINSIVYRDNSPVLSASIESNQHNTIVGYITIKRGGDMWIIDSLVSTVE